MLIDLLSISKNRLKFWLGSDVKLIIKNTKNNNFKHVKHIIVEIFIYFVESLFGQRILLQNKDKTLIRSGLEMLI